VLATNTSSLSVTEMQRALERPADFAGMHFFNPVHRMPLVEVIRGEQTSDEAVATVLALARRLDKTPVIVRDGPGFLVNRILAPYLNEAGWLLAEGAGIEQVDRVLRRFGMPMGPLRLLDEVGLDVARHAGAVMAQRVRRTAERAAAHDRAGERGPAGPQGRRGFYRYQDGREKGVNEEIYGRLGAVPAPRGSSTTRRSWTARCWCHGERGGAYPGRGHRRHARRRRPGHDHRHRLPALPRRAAALGRQPGHGRGPSAAAASWRPRTASASSRRRRHHGAERFY
jgi:3-hydroxyacyl-CoA dehydrogenase